MIAAINSPAYQAKIFGIGTDLLLVARIRRLHQKYGVLLQKKILSGQEAEALSGHQDPALFIAKCFAAKEAFVKALGTGFNSVLYCDCSLLRQGSGAPFLRFSPAMQQRLDTLKISHAHVSISDDDGRVLAFVVLECSAS